MDNAGKNMYEKLTIRDKFMFGKVTKNPVIAQKMADLLTPVEIGEVKGVEREKFLQHRSSSKYVKLDMYLEDENGRIEIHMIGDSLFFPRESPLVNALYKAYVDVTGDTENKPMVIGGGTYAKSLKNIIAFGPEMPGIDYRIHGADEFILVSGMEEAVLVYMEAIKNLLAI